MTVQTKKFTSYVLSILVLAGIFSAIWIYVRVPSISASANPQTIQTDTLFQTTVQTTDGAFSLGFKITPKSVGNNTFVTQVTERKTNHIRTDVSIDLYITNADMDMGTKVIHLKADGKDGFTANDELSMDGHWDVRMEVHTPQNTLHQAKVSFQVVS